MNDKSYPIIAADDFARRFSMRPGGLMWPIGVAASAAAGIPTAWDMIWELKQQLLVSQRLAEGRRRSLQSSRSTISTICLRATSVPTPKNGQLEDPDGIRRSEKLRCRAHETKRQLDQ
jgi:hypothetical protein